jgi:hypothetical protein
MPDVRGVGHHCDPGFRKHFWCSRRPNRPCAARLLAATAAGLLPGGPQTLVPERGRRRLTAVRTWMPRLVTDVQALSSDWGRSRTGPSSDRDGAPAGGRRGRERGMVCRAMSRAISRPATPTGTRNVWCSSPLAARTDRGRRHRFIGTRCAGSVETSRSTTAATGTSRPTTGRAHGWSLRPDRRLRGRSTGGPPP